MLKFKTGLPQSPFSLKFGYETTERCKVEQWRSIDLVIKSKAVQEEANKYYESFSFSSNKTLLHYRDYFIYKALESSLYNTQFTNKKEEELTNKAATCWKTFSFDQMWPYIPPDLTQLETPLRYWGELGTIAYYFQYLPQTTSIVYLLENTLKLIWNLVGTSYSKSPDARLLELLSQSSFSLELASSIQFYVPKLFNLQPLDKFYYLLVNTRLYSITEDCFSNLLLRIMLTEFHPQLFNCLTPLLPSFLEKPLVYFYKVMSSFLLPSGFLLLLQAFISEAYLRAANLINTLPDSLYGISLLELQTSKQYPEISSSIASYLSLAYDSYSILDLFKTRTDLAPILIQLEQDILSWLSIINYQPQTLEYRLTSFAP